jgi:hypothetical protein
MGCNQAPGGYQCRAAVEDPEFGLRDVTGLATWSTSDPTIATVSSVGFVTALKFGDVAVRANYRGADGFITLRVAPGGASF